MIMFTKKIKLEFKLEDVKLDDYIWQPSYNEFKKLINNFMINSYLEGNKDKWDTYKELLEYLYMKENEKKSWHSF